MGEKVVLVCDVCGRPAVETVMFRIGNRNRQKDLCSAHLSELESGSRTPRRGRKSAAVLASAPTGKRRGRPPGSRNTNPSGNGRRRGHPPKAHTAEPAASGE
jgi:hypothetical protein